MQLQFSSGSTKGARRVVRAMEHVLSTLGGNAGDSNFRQTPHELRVVSYADDFECLWGSRNGDSHNLPDFVRKVDVPLTLIVIWDGMPERTQARLINTDRYLTPLDWVVGLSLAIDAAFTESQVPLPALRIFIIDLISSNLSDSDSVCFFQQLPKRTLRSLPWMRLVRPSGPLNLDWTIGNLLWDFIRTPTEADLSEPSCVPFLHECYAGDSKPDLTLLRRMWSANLTQPSKLDDRHAIANLIGPMLLLNKCDDDSETQALRRLLQQVGLLSKKTCQAQSLETSASWISWTDESWKVRTRLPKGLEKRPWNFLVLDDGVFQNHWGEFICKALGAGTPPTSADPNSPRCIGQLKQDDLEVRVFAQDSPEPWLQALQLFDGTVRANHPGTQFCLPLWRSNTQDSVPLDVLFLDLRLFQAREADAEIKFITQLLPLARNAQVDSVGSRTLSSGQGQLPWPGFTVDELNKLKAWSRVAFEEKRDDREKHPDYELVLTLFPRLLALADMSLPIILFSSTGRRGIAEKLKAYGNIITDFEKPRLPALDPTYVLDESRTKFIRALEVAIPMVPARQLCAHLIRRSLPLPAPTTTDLHQRSEEAETPWHIELLLDEQGECNPTLTVGGLLVVYPPNVSPEEFDRQLAKQFPSIREDKKWGKNNTELVAEAICKASHTQNVFVAMVSLTGSANAPQYGSIRSSDELHDERVGDNLFRQLLRCVVELAIYGLARRRIPEAARVRFSVHAATRGLPPDDVHRPEPLEKRWGVTVKNVGPFAGLWDAADKLRGFETFASEEVVPPDVVKLVTFFNTTFAQIQKQSQIPIPPQLIDYFPWDAARPLVEEVMREYERASFEPRADIVRAFSLNSHGKRRADRIRVMHFFTDALLAKRNGGPSCEHLKDNGFHEQYGASLLKLLRGQRSLLTGRFAEAIAWGGVAWLATYGPNSNSFRAFGQDLSSAAQQMTGDEFLDLVRTIPATFEENSEAERLRGKVCSKQEWKVVIRGSDGIEYAAKHRSCKDFFLLKVGDEVTFEGHRTPNPGFHIARNVAKSPATLL